MHRFFLALLVLLISSAANAQSNSGNGVALGMPTCQTLGTTRLCEGGTVTQLNGMVKYGLVSGDSVNWGGTHTVVTMTAAGNSFIDSDGTILLRTNGAGTFQTVAQFDSTGVYPGTTNTYPLGQSGSVWSGLFAQTATFTSLTTGTNADFVCLSAAGVLLVQTSACTISSARFKNISGALEDDALAELPRFQVATYTMKSQGHPNADPNFAQPQIGLVAENIASIDPRMAIYEDDMVTPKSYRQEAIIAFEMKVLQEQQREIENLKHRTLWTTLFGGDE